MIIRTLIAAAVAGAVVSSAALAAEPGTTPLEQAATSYPALDAVASTFAGRPIEATCPSQEEWDANPYVRAAGRPPGFTRFEQGVPVWMWLSPPVCDLLVSYSARLAAPAQPACGGYARGGAPARYYREFAQRCQPAREELSTDPWIANATAAALLTLVHEAFHMGGVRDEGEAECRAIRSIEQAARQLGARQPARIVELAERIHAGLAPEYRSVC